MNEPAVTPAPTVESAGSPESGEAAEEDPAEPAVIREAVASFADAAHFRDAVKRLLAADFAPTDLSVLASHDSLEIAGGVPGYRGGPGGSLLAGLTDEVVFIDPLQVAGFSALAGGPIGAVLAAVVAAGLGGAALKEVVERLVANRHAPDFAAALEAGGVLLWVRPADAEREAQALAILGAAGGTDPHMTTRPADPA
jgi:hypothetical protein